MKRLFILIIAVLTLQSCFSQIATPSGFTRFYSNVAYDGLWAIKTAGIPVGDTATATVKGLGQLLQDAITGTVYHVVSLTGKRWEPMGGGGGTGVTSVGMTTTGALSVSPSSISSSGVFGLTWNSTAANYVHGDGSVSNFSNDVQTLGDARYMALGSTFPFSRISDGPTAVRSLFASGPGISISAGGIISATGQSVQDGLISGGVVTWSGTGLVFDVTAAAYVLGGAQYSTTTTQVTLDPADASYGRWDAIVVTNSGTVSKISGTPASSPVLPQTDPASQLLLTYVFIDAGATTPTQISNEVVYDENIEWSHSTSGSVTANFASTAFAEQGTKSIQTTWTSASNLIFTNGSVLSAGNYTTISFYVRLSGALANNTNVSLQFYNSTNAVSNSVTASISKSTTSAWQLVSFNVSQFSFTSTQFNSVRLILTGSTVGTLGTSTVYFDNIRLQAGITPPTQITGLQSAYTKVYDGTTTASATGSDQLRFRADNTMSVSVGSNDATYGDYVLIKADTTKLATINYVTTHSGGGITTMAAIGSTANADGASISGSTLTLQPASAFYGGVVTTGSQTFAGFKTFSSVLTLSGGFNATANSTVVSGSGDAFSVFNAGFSTLFAVSSDYTKGVGINESPVSGYSLSVNGIAQVSYLQINGQFTPTTSTDATYANGSLIMDDTYLWYRTSTGTWKKIAWTTF
jgi:hypothetical protein